MNYCIQCGSRLEKSNSFCTKCGTKIDDISVKQIITPVEKLEQQYQFMHEKPEVIIQHTTKRGQDVSTGFGRAFGETIGTAIGCFVIIAVIIAIIVLIILL